MFFPRRRARPRKTPLPVAAARQTRRSVRHRDNAWLIEQGGFFGRSRDATELLPTPPRPASFSSYVIAPLLQHSVTPFFLPRRLQPFLRFQPRTVFVLLRNGANFWMIRRGDAAIFVHVIFADLEIAAAEFRRDMQ